MGGESYEPGSSGPKTLVESPCGTLVLSVFSLDHPEQARNHSEANLIDNFAQFMEDLTTTIGNICYLV